MIWQIIGLAGSITLLILAYKTRDQVSKAMGFMGLGFIVASIITDIVLK